MRRLVSIRRRVGGEDLQGYVAGWSAVRAAVEGAGSHAWAFAAEGDSSERLEFLEFAEGADPRGQPDVAAALAALDQAFPATAEEWEEAG